MQYLNLTRTSRNLFGDLVGREKPDELVLIAAHTDAWDIGQGAQDDGVCFHFENSTFVLNSILYVFRNLL